MAALAKARPAAVDPARLTDTRRQHEDLAAILSVERVPARRMRMRIALPVAVAVAVGAVAVTLTVGRPAGQTVAAPKPAVDAHVALLNVASAVEHESGQGDYWRQDTESGSATVVKGADPYVVNHREGQQWSIGVRPGEQSLNVLGIDSTTEPLTSRDRARWQAAGSPAQVTADFGESDKKLGLRIGGGHQSVIRTDVAGDIVSVGDDNVTYAYLRDLPGDVPGLTKLLNHLYGQIHGDTDRTAWLFQQASGLITMPVSGQVRAAAYRIIAGLPGSTSLGTVTDALGRTGVGVALPVQRMGDLGTARQELIVDPRTDTLLADEQVLVEPSALAAGAGLTKGQPLNYAATTSIGWTDEQIAH
jgi:hypothetical protein